MLLPNFIKKIKNTDNAIFARMLEKQYHGENKTFDEWMDVIEYLKHQPPI